MHIAPRQALALLANYTNPKKLVHTNDIENYQTKDKRSSFLSATKKKEAL
jgi:hypothetical protein